jgi:hypothetical protein
MASCIENVIPFSKVYLKKATSKEEKVRNMKIISAFFDNESLISRIAFLEYLQSQEPNHFQSSFLYESYLRKF